MKLKIMSFNTQHCCNYITKKIDYDVMADAIKRENADIVGLNEMRSKGVREDYEAQTDILAEKLGYYFYFAKAIDVGGCNPYGNGIVSRYPIVKAETVMIKNPDIAKCETRCLLKAEIDVDGKIINVCVTHVGLSFPEQVEAVNTAEKAIDNNMCVLMGDFNVTPENAVLDRINAVMFDTAKLFDEPLLSFPSDKPEIKIDYIFTSKDLKVLSADIPEIVASDHRPHTAVIEF